MTLEQFRRALYLSQRSIGDVQAAQRGGAPRLAKRVLRRKITAAAYRRWGR